MPDGWIYESPCGCVLHKWALIETTFVLCGLVCASRMCALARSFVRGEAAPTQEQLREHIYWMLSQRESELRDESFTY